MTRVRTWDGRPVSMWGCVGDLIMILELPRKLMAKTEASSDREKRRHRVLEGWSERTGVDLARLDSGQQWVIFAALQIASLFGKRSVLKRILVFLLARCDMGLRPTVIAAVVETSDRTVRNVRAYSPEELLASVRQQIGGNHKPKLEAVHAGVVAKLLVEHPKARVNELLNLIAERIGITVDRLTLRRFLKQYGLGCLRGEIVTDRAPLLPKRCTEEHFS